MQNFWERAGEAVARAQDRVRPADAPPVKDTSTESQKGILDGLTPDTDELHFPLDTIANFPIE